VLAEQTLKEARGLIVTGFTPASDLLSNARAVHLLAESIYTEMKERSAALVGKTPQRLERQTE
jgi:hypothetical protein